MSKKNQAPAVVNTPSMDMTPAQMLSMAVSQGGALDKIEKLMDMQGRWEANEARKAFVKAMNEFNKNSPTIIKDKTVGYTNKQDQLVGYTHATLGNIIAVVAPVLGKYGLSHRWVTNQSADGIQVTCFLTHELGHYESSSLIAGADTSGSKNSVQAIASTCSYLERYTFMAVCGLAASDQDDDARSAEPAPPRPTKKAAPKGESAKQYDLIDAYGDKADIGLNAQKWTSGMQDMIQDCTSGPMLLALWEFNEGCLNDMPKGNQTHLKKLYKEGTEGFENNSVPEQPEEPKYADAPGDQGGKIKVDEPKQEILLPEDEGAV